MFLRLTRGGCPSFPKLLASSFGFGCDIGKLFFLKKRKRVPMGGFIGHVFYAETVPEFIELVEMKVRILS